MALCGVVNHTLSSNMFSPKKSQRLLRRSGRGTEGSAGAMICSKTHGWQLSSIVGSYWVLSAAAAFESIESPLVSVCLTLGPVRTSCSFSRSYWSTVSCWTLTTSSSRL